MFEDTPLNAGDPPAGGGETDPTSTPPGGDPPQGGGKGQTPTGGTMPTDETPDTTSDPEPPGDTSTTGGTSRGLIGDPPQGGGD